MESESESEPVPASCFEIDQVYAPEAVVPLVRELLQRLSDGLPSAIDTERGREALRQGIVPPLLDCLSNLRHFRSMPSISIDELATREKSSSRREEELNQDLARVESIIRGITLRLDWMKDPQDPNTFLEDMSLENVGRFVEWRILQLRDCVKHYAGLNYKLWEDTQNFAKENGRLKEEAAESLKSRLNAEEELRREKGRSAEEADRLEAQLRIVQQESSELVSANMELKAQNTTLVQEARTWVEKQKSLRAEHDKIVADLEAGHGALKDHLRQDMKRAEFVQQELQRKEDECQNIRATLVGLQAHYGCERAAHHDARAKLKEWQEHSRGSKIDSNIVEDLKLQVQRLQSSLHDEKLLRQRERDEYETALKTQSVKHARELSTLRVDLEQSRNRCEDVVEQHRKEIRTKDAEVQSRMTAAQKEAEAALNEQRERYEHQMRKQDSEHELKLADVLSKVKEAQDKADQAQKEASHLLIELEELQEKSDAYPQLIQETFYRVFTPRTKESLAYDVSAPFEEQLSIPARKRGHADIDPITPTPSNAKRSRLENDTHLHVTATKASAGPNSRRRQANGAGVEREVTVPPQANGLSQPRLLMPPPSPQGMVSGLPRYRPWTPPPG
ncbi:hypothetical protein PV04_05693 [Phialophora macrospora]|uniref:Uncharacterized protein n=1 Tax=Phialophora macrospora TaxID=1851006 RepID=A0A0D2DW60_9EURO|nr:hypothetical protein PV04_05693 [Phialophora macrospora]